MNATSLPSILPTGQFCRAHIMRRAGQLYRRFNGQDRLDKKLALLSAWAEARGEMAIFQARNAWHCTRMVVVARDVSVPA